MVVLITGASSGIGKACAKIFSKKGYKTILIGRRKNLLLKLSKELGEKNNLPIKLDVRNKKQVFKIISKLPNSFKKISILINNAGLAWGLEPSHKVDIKKWETMIDTNCKGLIYVTRAVLPGLIKRNKGHIINLGSVAGTYPYAGGNVYGGTKAFVKQFSLGLKSDLLGTKVKITNIEPGMADTEFSLVRFSGNKKKADKVYKNMTPLNGIDIAETILWCTNTPSHVNINRIEIMPLQQGFNFFAIDRSGKIK
ncbi:MAG: NADP-dependent 3-hydroxy acid dehydrogenase YdfG [Alphaproteobacteria bacterium MarineAlpha6_Bin3]|nr:MAG: NADP-dependent 3-hydroxy acid dehydrogenase YdfG [Alphaproteobacteria bacterium MarineAlpha6_Bin3]|tara:strand:- start:274 stop:1032 length:759 start_codon:yes stop_codon:yes gene_type:complete